MALNEVRIRREFEGGVIYLNVETTEPLSPCQMRTLGPVAEAIKTWAERERPPCGGGQSVDAESDGSVHTSDG